MNKDEGRLFLGEVRRIDSRIRRMKDQVDTLRASLLPSGIRYDTDRVQTSARDPLPEVMARIDELEGQIIRLHIQRAEAVLRIEAAIDSIGDPELQEILTAFYSKGERARAIAKRLHYSRSGLYKLIDKAIIQLETK